jgi:uncharacterized membrane protein
MFVTFAALRNPMEVSQTLFVILGILFVTAAVVNDLGILEFNGRIKVTWHLGMGRFPPAKFALMAGSDLAILVQTKVSGVDHLEDADSKHRLLIGYGISVFFHITASLLTMAIRDRKTAIDTQNHEWWPFIIEIISHFAMILAAGSFWLVFNPGKWSTIDTSSSSFSTDLDVPFDDDLLVDYSPLPHRGQTPEFVLK